MKAKVKLIDMLMPTGLNSFPWLGDHLVVLIYDADNCQHEIQAESMRSNQLVATVFVRRLKRGQMLFRL
ncbi:hypothetical protein OUZ56_029187 [Daphnia magna]|uniref:Uncharacterized protein n=1 Tax=Daphnia magna TaxID=35525 RepID=A0ABR0B637_9CRUS|nr:hypothetical protein OUZ56_029187 [Daphnia magna]